MKTSAVTASVSAAAYMGLMSNTQFANLPQNYGSYNELPTNALRTPYVSGNSIYIPSDRGVSISHDGGATFSTKTFAQGLRCNNAYGVSLDSSGRIFVATSCGLSVSTDGGNTFSNTPLSGSLLSVYISGSVIYVGHYNGGMSFSTDGGASFTNRTTAHGLASNYVTGFFVDGTTVYAYHSTYASTGFSYSTNGCTSFLIRNQATNSLPSNSVYGIWANGAIIYAATSGGVGISTDGGVTFSTRTTTQGLGHNMVRSIAVLSGNIYAGTNSGVSVSTNSGTSFTNYAGCGAAEGMATNGTRVYIATWGNGLYYTDNGGVTCNQRSMNQGLRDVIVSDVYVDGNYVVASTWGGLAISNDGGATFNNRTPANSSIGDWSVYGIQVVGSTIYAATFGGLSISTDGGISFTTRTLAHGLATLQCMGVYVSGSSVYVWHGGYGGGLSISTNGGASFTAYNMATNGLASDDVKHIYANASGTTIYAATQGGLSISTNGGTNFTNYTTAQGLANNDTYKVRVVGANIYVASWGGLSHSNNGGASFTTLFGTSPINDIYINGAQIYLAVNNTVSGLAVSNNSGASFTPITVVPAQGTMQGVTLDGSRIYAWSQQGLHRSL